jgi:hypothetical protein
MYNLDILLILHYINQIVVLRHIFRLYDLNCYSIYFKYMETSRIALVVIVLLLITGGILLYNNTGTNRNLLSRMQNIPQVGEGGGPESPSITPSMQVYSGEIVSVSFSPLQYKDAIPVTIHENGIPLNLYVTSETNIYTNDNKLVPRSYLREGMVIQAQGIPVEGGIDLQNIRIQSSEKITKDKEPTATISPSPSKSVLTPTVTPSPTNTITPSTSP